MSRIPPIPPQIGIIVGFDFVGRFNSEWKTIGVVVVSDPEAKYKNTKYKIQNTKYKRFHPIH